MTAKIREYLSSLSDSELLSAVASLSATFHHQKNAYANVDEIAKLVPMQQKLYLHYLECEARGILELYLDHHMQGAGRQKLVYTKANKGVLKAHLAYQVPGYKKADKLVAIHEYASSGDSYNLRLRDAKRYRQDSYSKRYFDTTKVLDRAMIAMPEDVTLFRGFTLPTKEYPTALNVGDVFHEKGYMGTTARRAVAKDFACEPSSHRHSYFVEITAPEGTPYFSIWNGAVVRRSYIEKEQEIVLARDSKLQITGEKKPTPKGTRVLTARVI